MSKTNRRAAPQRQPPPRDSNRPPDPTHFTNRAHMCKISNENGPETTVWHYRLTKHHQHDMQQQKQRTSPQEMLIELIDALSSDDKLYFLAKQNCYNTTVVVVL